MDRHKALKALSSLWLDLPASLVRFRVPDATDPFDLGILSDTLRRQAWRQRCSRASTLPCVDLARPCLHPNSSLCRADALFPMFVGGGSPKWRTATLRLQWWPGARELRLVALGDAAIRELGWAVRTLHEQHGLLGSADPGVQCVGDLGPAVGTRWRLTTATPWVFAKEAVVPSAAPHATQAPSPASIAEQLCRDMALRGRRMVALCTTDLRWQRIGGELAMTLAQASLGDSLKILRCELVQDVCEPKSSGGNGGQYARVSWSGYVDAISEEWAAPWVGLLALLSVGQAGDKGSGAVELHRLD